MTLADLSVKISAEGVESTVNDLGKVNQGITKVVQQESGLSSLVSTLGVAAAGFAAVATSIFAYGKAAIDATIPLDSAKRALQSVSNNTKEYEQNLRDLQEAAKLPGLGFQEVVSGSVKLQGAGISAKTAKDSIVELGNAIANAGRGKAEFGAAVDQLSKMAGLGKVTTDDMNEIAAYAPAFRKAFKEAFGTLDMEKFNKKGIDIETVFKKINEQLRDMPRAAISFQTSIDNLGDAFQVAMEPLGSGMLNAFMVLTQDSDSFFNQLKQVNEELGRFIEKLGIINGPIRSNFANGFTSVFRYISDLITKNVTDTMYLFHVVETSLTNLGKLVGRGANALFGLLDPNMKKGTGLEFDKFMGYDEFAQGTKTAMGVVDAIQIASKATIIQDRGKDKDKEREKDNDGKESKNHLKQISANTGKTANALEFNRQLFGGRQLGQLGVTAVELGMSRDRFRGSTQIPGSTMINRGILQLVQQSQRQYLNTPLGRY